MEGGGMIKIGIDALTVGGKGAGLFGYGIILPSGHHREDHEKKCCYDWEPACKKLIEYLEEELGHKA